MPEELKDEERQLCEIWTRVMGYHRPVSEWNKGKKQEFASRKHFSINKMRGTESETNENENVL